MPKSGSVCFVCGSYGANFFLHSKCRKQGPYFPFLEYHEPPKGCSNPGPDGVVSSCRVCYAFLTQQWDTYERNKTPALKRLYWLKRTDELTFTGAEMKLQGEYMARVMGLQYQANGIDNCSILSHSPEQFIHTSDSRNSNSSVNHVGNVDSNIFLHSGLSQVKNCSNLDDQCEYGSSVTHGSEDDIALDLTLPSKILKNTTETPTSVLSDFAATNLKDIIACFLCGLELFIENSKLISSIYVSPSKPFFPFLENVVPPKGSFPVKKEHHTYACPDCYDSICKQWNAYEQSYEKPMNRIYKVNDKYFPDVSCFIDYQKQEKMPFEDVCYLCGKLQPQSVMDGVSPIVPIYTVPRHRRHLMYFPFVRELSRPSGAQPLNPDGTVLVCFPCRENLKAQWDEHENRKVPFSDRHYSLIQHAEHSDSNKVFCVKNEILESNQHHQNEQEFFVGHDSQDATQPQDMQICKSPVLHPNTSQYLLTISSQSDRCIFGDICSNESVSKIYKSGMTANDTSMTCVSYQKETEHSNADTNHSVMNTYQDFDSLAKLCFICGEALHSSNYYTLSLFPSRHDTSFNEDLHVAPFFPLLAKNKLVRGCKSIIDNGVVISCSLCYYNLIRQWMLYEKSQLPEDNRWLRKYTFDEFICYTCGQLVPREEIDNLEVHKFPFLKDLRRPDGAIVMNSGQAVAACKSCCNVLAHEYTEYDLLGVQQEFRKYSLCGLRSSMEGRMFPMDSKQCPSQVIDSNSGLLDSKNTNGQVLMSAGADIRNFAMGMGNPLSRSPTPKSLLSVHSNSQVSPGNGPVAGAVSPAVLGTSKSSTFSAALRMLAHQAKDDDTQSLLTTTRQGASPANNRQRPCSTRPKRVVVSSSSVVSGSNGRLLPSSSPTYTTATTPISRVQPSAQNGDSGQSVTHIPFGRSAVLQENGAGVKGDQNWPIPSNFSHNDGGPVASSVDSAAVTATRLQVVSSGDTFPRLYSTYKKEDELCRLAGPSMLPPYSVDPAYAAFHPAFLPPHGFQSASSVRAYDDHVLEQLRLMQTSPYLPFSGTFLPHPAVYPTYSSGPAPHPTEMAYPYPYMSSVSSVQADNFHAAHTSTDRSRCDREHWQDTGDNEEEVNGRRHRQQDMVVNVSSDGGGNGPSMGSDVLCGVKGNHGVLNVPCVFTGNHDGPVDCRRITAAAATHSGSKLLKRAHRDKVLLKRSTSGVEVKSCDGRGVSAMVETVADHASDLIDPSPLQSKCHEHVYRRISSPQSPLHSNSAKETDKSTGHTSLWFSQERPNSTTTHNLSIFRPFEGASVSPNSTRNVEGHRQSSSYSPHHPSYVNGITTITPIVDSFHYDASKVKLVSTDDGYHHVEKFDFKSLAKECSPYKTVACKEFCPSAVLVGEEYLGMKSPVFYDSMPHRTGVVSCMDVREKLLREARLDPNFDSDSDDECDLEDGVERWRDELTVLDNVFPSRLLLTSDKSTLLACLGLTTIQISKDIQQQKVMKWRRGMGEDCVCPIEMEEDDTEQSFSSPPSPSCFSPVSVDVTSEKMRFLHGVELISVRLRQTEHSQFCGDSALRNKRKFGEMSPSSDALLLSVSGEPIITAADLCRSHRAAAKQDQDRVNQLNPSSSNSVLGRAMERSQSVVFPANKDRLSREFAEQFHESVLRSTIQKEHQRNAQLGSSQQDTILLYSSTVATTLPTAAVQRPTFLWPGIEGVLESYTKHKADQQNEAKLLDRRYSQLKADNAELREAEEMLSSRLHMLEEERHSKTVEREHLQLSTAGLTQGLSFTR